jgi:DNA-binding PadR family transcriptional regulator
MPHDRAAAPLSTPVFQILLSLVGEALHGYAIIQDVAERTDGEVRLTASTLYDAVKRLLDAGWIAELATPPRGVKDDPRRRYYRITRAGLAAVRAEAARLERQAAMARAKLRPHLRPTRGSGA